MKTPRTMCDTGTCGHTEHRSEYAAGGAKRELERETVQSTTTQPEPEAERVECICHKFIRLHDGDCPVHGLVRKQVIGDGEQPEPEADEWQVSGYAESNRPDGQRVVRITIPHPEGGGQDVAEVLEAYAPLIVMAVNHHAQLVAVLEQALGVGQHNQTCPTWNIVEWMREQDLFDDCDCWKRDVKAALASVRQP